MGMQPISRRQYLALGLAGAAGGLAGCVSGRLGGKQWEGEIRINEDSHARFSILVDSPAELSYSVEVLEGPRIDAILLPRTAWLGFLFQSGWSANEDGSRYRIRRADVEGVRLSPDRWFLVLDNSDRGPTQPPSDYRNNQALVALRYRTAPQ